MTGFFNRMSHLGPIVTGDGEIETVILSGIAELVDIGLPWVLMRGSSVVHRFRGSGGTRGGGL
jgi:hypothetical protein